MGGKLRVAVIGLGRAGRARVRALEDHPRAELAAVVRRAPGPGERHLYEVVEDPSIDAAIVCTPNLLHAETAQACLEAGKHVNVEFPLAKSAARAEELFALAARAERVLHVEHIELLSPSQRAQRERAAPLGRPTGGELAFSGSDEGWIGDGDLAGSPALRAVARLHRLVDLFGEIASSRAHLPRADERGYRLEVELEFRAGGSTRLVEERGPGLPRETRWGIRCEAGLLDAPPPAGAAGLFAEDLEWFLSRIWRGSPSYVSDERVLHVLAQVEAIDATTGAATEVC